MGDRLTTHKAMVTHVSIGLDGEGRAVAAVRLDVWAENRVEMRSVPVTANPHNLRAIMNACGQTKLRACDDVEVSVCIENGRVYAIGNLGGESHTVWS